MDEKLILRGLQQLERIANQPQRITRFGFNNRKKKAGFKLKSQPIELSELTKKEKQLQKDIKDIDIVLRRKKGPFRYHRGFLFSEGVSNQVPEQFAKMLVSSSNAIEFGFTVWRLCPEETGLRLVRKKASNSPLSFGEKLTERSLAKLAQYTGRKMKQSQSLIRQDWQYFSRPSHHKTKTEPSDRYSEMKKYKKGHRETEVAVMKSYKKSPVDMSLSESHLISLLQMKGNVRPRQGSSFIPSSQMVSKALKFSEMQPLPCAEQLRVMLLKQNRVVSVWVPPSSSASMLCVFSVQVREKQVGVRVCWLLKYWMVRYGVDIRLFDSLLDWLQSFYGPIDELSLTVTKRIYDNIFVLIGWRINCWINDEQVRISYRRRN